MFRIAAVTILGFSLSAVPALAADGADGRSADTAETLADDKTVVAGVDWSMSPVRLGSAPKRPGALAGLYVSLAGLQVYDMVSTSRGLSLGAREANPIMRGAVNNGAMFWGIKAATTALPMVIAEKMWKKNRVGAVVMMVAANSVAAIVASNNARVLNNVR